MVHRDGDDWLLDCQLQPRAKRDEIAGEHGGALKVRVQAPPVDGAANKALVALLAKEFGVSKARVVVEKGATGRRKRVRIQSAGQLPASLTGLSASGDR